VVVVLSDNWHSGTTVVERGEIVCKFDLIVSMIPPFALMLELVSSVSALHHLCH